MKWLKYLMQSYLSYFFLISTPLYSLNIEYELEKQSVIKNKKIDYLRSLQQVKYFLISGNFVKAKNLLRKLVHEPSINKKIALRYQAYLAFLQNDYKTSLQILKSPYFQGIYDKIVTCPLFLESSLYESENKDFKKRRDFCFRATNQYTSQGTFLFDHASDFIFRPKAEDSFRNFIMLGPSYLINPSYSYLWTKLALYFSKYVHIIRNLHQLHESDYKSKRFREVLAFLFYRLEKKNLAMTFVKGLKTPNSYNLSGMVNLIQGNESIAYNFFTKTLSLKENSFLALNVLIPLSWRTKRYQEGYQFLKMLIVRPNERIQHLALLAAFSLKLGLREKSLEYLQNALKYEGHDLNFELFRLLALNQFLLKNNQKALYASQIACDQHDGLSCWLYGELLRWPNFSQTLSRPDPIYQEKDQISALKEPWASSQFEETIFIEKDEIIQLDLQDGLTAY